MKLNAIDFKKSTFRTAEKDLQSIIQRLISNETLKRLLFYQTSNAMKEKNISDEETIGLLDKSILIIPDLSIATEKRTYVIVTFDNFMPNPNNPEFRDNIITFDVLCHKDCWKLDDYQLRPYKICGEIDGMFDGQKLNGIGKMQFGGASQLLVGDLLGFTIGYQVVNDV